MRSKIGAEALELRSADAMAGKSVSKKRWAARLLDFIEHPLFLYTAGTISGLIGIFFYTPVLVVCGFCVVLAFHRVGVVDSQSPRVKVVSYSVVLILVSLLLYEARKAIGTGTQEYVQEMAKAIVSQTMPYFESRLGRLTQVSTTEPKSHGTAAAQREERPRETKPRDLGIHSPNETLTIPPNSSATIAYGKLSPEDKAGLGRMEKEFLGARVRLAGDPDRLTLHDLFLTDFVVGDADTTSTNRGGFTIRNSETGGLTHIQYIVVRQIETGNKFLLFYVLYTNETERICEDLADKYEVALNSFMEGRVETQKTPGDAEATSSQELVFSRRIFIYHETYLSPEQVIAIRNGYQKRGLVVVLRGTDYLDNQKLKAKVKLLERKH